MRYRRNASLDPSQVEDRRGQGPMMGLPGGGLTVGGGGLGIVGVVIWLLVTALNSSGGISGPLGNLDRSTGSQTPAAHSRTSGSQANTREDCRIVADINSVQAYWTGNFRAGGKTYEPAKTVFFTGSTHTGWGPPGTGRGAVY